jgi:hypothetical protein
MSCAMFLSDESLVEIIKNVNGLKNALLKFLNENSAELD